ncbi:MAG: hypothetical protein WBN96_13610 [Gammaproteobacteria bacterium]
MDLIPEDYKRYLQKLRVIKISGISMLMFLSLSLLIAVSLKYISDDYQQDIVVLEHKKAISSQQRSVLQDLEKQRNQLVKKHQVLEKLRGGALAEDMFVNIDRSLSGNNVWFKNWSFVRAGSVTNEEVSGVNTGYFIVIPENERASKKQQAAWKIQTHMEMNGQAIDHEALSSFVRRALQQPQIRDVRILNTQTRTYNDTAVVDFKLIITVNTGHTST